MNIVLQNLKDEDYYIATIKKVDDVFYAFGKRIHFDGKVVAICQRFPCASLREAEHKVRDLVKTKIKRRGWKPVDLESLPKEVVKFLEVPPEMQISPEEMVLILRGARLERYVRFWDVNGLEEFFDVGVEYIGFVLADDENIFKVFDRFGTLRDCFKQRMSHIDPTERAIEARHEGKVA